jgi:amino-acid N-acetyltransferase
MEVIKYRPAVASDLAAVRALLEKCGLPQADIAAHLPAFWVAETGGNIIGVNGIEIYKPEALLRSLAVDSQYRGRGISRELNARLLERARQMGVERLYLLTLTAESYSARLGFQKVARDSLPAAIQATAEFRSLCPQTAVCMFKEII